MKTKILLVGILATISTTSIAQIGVFGKDANGNTTEKCSDAGWDKSDCSLTKIKIGEVIPDKKEVNCSGVSKTIYNTLADGKPIMIFSEAWGCGPCWDSAPEKANYIQAHKSKINFWIPLCEYFGNDAECKTDNRLDRRSVEGWQNSFPGLKDAFMFLDNDRTYNLIGIPAQPGVGVFDPKTKKLVYSGYDFGKAEKIAEELGKNITANEEMMKYNFSFYPNPAKDKLNIITTLDANVVEIITLDGKVMSQVNFSGTNTNIDLTNIPKGIYVLKVNNKVEQLIVD